MDPLQELDEVAYLRFASVYSSFNSIDDFAKAIEELRKRKQTPKTKQAPTGLTEAGLASQLG